MKISHRNSPLLICVALLGLAMALPTPSGASSITHPTAPRSVHAVARSASAKVNWLKPLSNGGAPIVDYVVTSHPGLRKCATATTMCVVQGLSNGHSYDFTVVAINRKGTGATSRTSNSVKPGSTAATTTTTLARVTQTTGSGSGNNSITVSVPSSDAGWGAQWDYNCSNVYMKDSFVTQILSTGSTSDVGVNEFGLSGSGVSEYHDTGNFTYDITSACHWDVTIFVLIG